MAYGYRGMFRGAWCNGRSYYIADDYGNMVRVNEQWLDWETEIRLWDRVTEAEIYA